MRDTVQRPASSTRWATRWKEASTPRSGSRSGLTAPAASAAACVCCTPPPCSGWPMTSAPRSSHRFRPGLRSMEPTFAIAPPMRSASGWRRRECDPSFDRPEILYNPVPIEPTLDLESSSSAQFSSKILVTQYLPDRLGSRFDIPRLNQETCHSVLHRIRNSAAATCYDRHSTPGGFDQRQSEPLDL